MNHALDNALSSARAGKATNLEIRTDSEYTQKSMTIWGDKWDKNGYMSSTGSAVTNADLVKAGRDKISELRSLNSDVKIEHVRGHAGNYGNEQADKLANDGAMKR